jgi:hypothetical protein
VRVEETLVPRSKIIAAVGLAAEAAPMGDSGIRVCQAEVRHGAVARHLLERLPAESDEDEKQSR